MTMSTTCGGRAPGRALKSPLAAPGGIPSSHAGGSGALAPASGRAPLTDREATIAEFPGASPDREQPGRAAFRGKTITAYSDPAKSLDRWMTANKTSGDFTVVDTATLNRYLRAYYLEHGQRGTHTLQRNLIQLFTFLERERGCATPYTERLNRYAAVKGRPTTLSSDFIDELLEVTEAGRQGTSRPPATTRSSASCAARASAAWSCSAWSCTRFRRT